MFLSYDVCVLYLSHRGFICTAKHAERVKWTQKLIMISLQGCLGTLSIITCDLAIGIVLFHYKVLNYIYTSNM